MVFYSYVEPQIDSQLFCMESPETMLW